MSALDNSESIATVHVTSIRHLSLDDRWQYTIKFLSMQSALHNVLHFSIKMQLPKYHQIWHNVTPLTDKTDTDLLKLF